jgi:hypothetical protein
MVKSEFECNASDKVVGTGMHRTDEDLFNVSHTLLSNSSDSYMMTYVLL